MFVIIFHFVTVSFIIAKKNSRKTNRNRCTQGQSNQIPAKKAIALSTATNKVVLDGSFVAEYLHRQAIEKGKENQTPINLCDSDDDDSDVEFVCKKQASPGTLRYSKLIERLNKLERENRNLKKEVNVLKEGAVPVQSDEPIQSETSAAPIADNEIGEHFDDWGVSYDEEWINGQINDVIANGNLTEIEQSLFEQLN